QDGGGNDSSDNAVLTLNGCSIRDNIAETGGGGLANNLGSTADATDTVFSDNTMNAGSEFGGGVLNVRGSQLTLTRCQILNNQSPRSYGIGLANVGNFGFGT